MGLSKNRQNRQKTPPLRLVFLQLEKITKFWAKNCRFYPLYKREKMRYNDKALEKGAWCTAVNHCAEYQAYDTNTGNAFLPAVHF